MPGTMAPWFLWKNIRLKEFDKVIAVHLRAAFLLSKLVLAGNVRAQVWRHFEHFQHFGQGSLWVGLGVCGCEGRHTWIDARDGSGGCASGRACECHLPRPGDGDGHVQGIGQYAGEETGCQPRRTIERLLGFVAARPRPDRRWKLRRPRCSSVRTCPAPSWASPSTWMAAPCFSK